MRIRRLLPFAAVVALLSPALLAGSLEKYKNWASSPQGYFMTKAERAEWTANVKTDAEAEAFINKFVESRGGVAFTQDVARRAEMADKHLTVGGRAGSLTTRGKLVILLGPPSSFNIARRETKGNASGTANMYSNAGGGGGTGGGGGGVGVSASDMNDAAIRQNMSGSYVQDYTFVYKADVLPLKQSKDVTIVIEVNPNNGMDKFVDRKVGAQLDDIFDAAAAARQAATAPPPAPKP